MKGRYVNKRSHRIITEVRLKLGEIATDQIGNKNNLIYDRANMVQDEILRETKCNELEFFIYTINGVEEYDINIESYNYVKSVETSWGAPLIYVSPAQFEQYSATGGNRPYYFTLYDKKIRLRPNPIIADEEIHIWAYQDNVIINMDDDIPPEVPSYADKCLILGICAEFEPENFFELYQDAKNKVAINAHSKIAPPKTSTPNW